MNYDFERPDRDYPGYHDAMEWETWDYDGREVIEDDEIDGE